MPQADAPRNAGRVAVLLACYNGEKYLEEQLRSLFAQTYDDFVLLVRDDGSTDATPAILARWARDYPDRVIVVADNRGNLRSKANFALLMELCEAPYFAFCDQDDIWLPEKLQIMLGEIQRLETRHGKSVPVLVHSDVKIVDPSLRELYPSYFAHRRVNLKTATGLPDILFKNVVTGCAMMGNRALLELGRPIPEQVHHHDWWMALVAAGCGIIKTLPTPTVLYRQHGNNVVGAGPPEGRSAFWDGRHVLQQPRLLRTRLRTTLELRRSCALILLRLGGDRMPGRTRDVLHVVCLPLLRDEIAHLPWPRRSWLFLRFIAMQVRTFPAVLRCCS